MSVKKGLQKKRNRAGSGIRRRQESVRSEKSGGGVVEGSKGS
jgi:hypothetical protein